MTHIEDVIVREVRELYDLMRRKPSGVDSAVVLLGYRNAILDVCTDKVKYLLDSLDGHDKS